jgi:hypothetical protein
VPFIEGQGIMEQQHTERRVRVVAVPTAALANGSGVVDRLDGTTWLVVGSEALSWADVMASEHLDEQDRTVLRRALGSADLCGTVPEQLVPSREELSAWTVHRLVDSLAEELATPRVVELSAAEVGVLRELLTECREVRLGWDGGQVKVSGDGGMWSLGLRDLASLRGARA